MSQSVIVTLITLLLYLVNLFGGGTPPADRPGTVPNDQSGYTQPSSNEQLGIVTAQTLVAHSSPEAKDEVASLTKGDYVDILDQGPSWYQVRVPDGRIGYVASFAISLVGKGTRSKMVLGYYVQDSRVPSLPSLETNYDTLTAISPWTWLIEADGTLKQNFSTSDLGQALEIAGDRGLETYALVHNYKDGRFDPSLVHKLLIDPSHRRTAIDGIYNVLRDWGMTGIHIDLENVPPSDREYLTQFMDELNQKLKSDPVRRFKVTMAVPAKTTDNRYSTWSGAFDYSELYKHVDAMMLMTYDEYHSGGSPGPIASIDWVTDVIKFTLKQGVPSSKVVLGIPAYGYDWPKNWANKDATARAITYEGAMNLKDQYGVDLQWDSTAKVPYFTYGDGRKVYFENMFSISHKLRLVNQYQLAGISLWRLGQEDPKSWDIIRQLIR